MLAKPTRRARRLHATNWSPPTPPYYDKSRYADLSDFSTSGCAARCAATFPDLFATLAVPKAEELVATPYRTGSKEKAEAFFLDGMTPGDALPRKPGAPASGHHLLRLQAGRATASTAPAAPAGTPSSPPSSNRLLHQRHVADAHRTGQPMIGSGTNPPPQHHPRLPPARRRRATATRREFVTRQAALRRRSPTSSAAKSRRWTRRAGGHRPGHGGLHPLATVLDAEGRPLTVRDALASSTRPRRGVAEQEGDFDADTRWALAWFEQQGFAEDTFGQANVLATAKNTSVAGMVEAGIVAAKAGKVRLLRPDELPNTWDPAHDAG